MLFKVLVNHFNNSLCLRFQKDQIVDILEAEGKRNPGLYSQCEENVIEQEAPIAEIEELIIGDKLAQREDIAQLSDGQKRDIVKQRRIKK